MQAVTLYLSWPEIPDAPAVMEMAAAENFSVAARILSREDRVHLRAIYGFARLADELGDEYGGPHRDAPAQELRAGGEGQQGGLGQALERLAALDWLEGELDNAYAGKARHPLLRELQSTLSECDLPREPFARLIEANRMDQRTQRYRSWEQLEGYCELSANPVGELVLRVFGLFTPARLALSDKVCTGLQLVEHLQDLAEDVPRGRLYLPAEDLIRFGSSHEQLLDLFTGSDGEGEDKGARTGARAQPHDPQSARAQLREVVRFETGRVRELLRAGSPLVRGVPGRAKLAVAGFLAGGLAAVEAIERADFDVLDGAPRSSRSRRAWTLVRVLAARRR